MTMFRLVHNSLTTIIFIIFFVGIFGVFNAFNSHIGDQKVEKTILSGTGCIKESIAAGRSYYNTDISISMCFFTRSSVFSGNGGVIYISDDDKYSMSIESSVFYNCACNDEGGAIYCNLNNSIIKRVCASKCSGQEFDHFGLVQASNVNLIEYLTISSCAESNTGSVTFSVGKGNQVINNINCSNNHVEYYSCLSISIPTTMTISRCTFANNEISKSKCIQFSRNSGTMVFTNIINNHCPASEVVFVRGAYEIQYCIFDNNEKTLFNVIEGSLQISHSFISHVGDLTMNTPVITTVNNTFEKHATYDIDHYNSFFCVSSESPNNDPKKGNLLIWICVITVVIFCGYVIYDSFFVKRDIPYDAIQK